MAKVFAGSAARHAAVAALGVLAVATVAGVVRLLPLFLADHVPLRLVPVLARGVAGVALETALFVAPPIGWALAAARLVDRGEARALFALGVHPARIVLQAWTAAFGMAAAAALAAALWGTEASAPGRSLQAMLDEARAACASAPPPAVADVPILGASWVCLAGEPPRVVGRAPSGDGAFAASALRVSDDLRSLEASDLDILARGPATAPSTAGDDPPGDVRMHAASASLRGLAPVGRASNLRPTARAGLLALASTAFAMAAATLVLAGSTRSRPAALALGAAGPAAALLVFSALERAPAPKLAYAAVVVAGLLALTFAAAFLGWRARRARQAG